MFELKIYDKKMQEDIEEYFHICFNDLGCRFEPKGRHSDITNIQEIYMLNGCFWCLYLENKIIGTVAIRSIGDKIAEMKRLYILNNYQGFGYGNLLFKTALDFAKNNKYNKILADTRNDSKASQYLMRKYGFQEIPKYNDNSFAELFFELVI